MPRTLPSRSGPPALRIRYHTLALLSLPPLHHDCDFYTGSAVSDYHLTLGSLVTTSPWTATKIPTHHTDHFFPQPFFPNPGVPCPPTPPPRPPPNTTTLLPIRFSPPLDARAMPSGFSDSSFTPPPPPPPTPPPPPPPPLPSPAHLTPFSFRFFSPPWLFDLFFYLVSPPPLFLSNLRPPLYPDTPLSSFLRCIPLKILQ